MRKDKNDILGFVQKYILRFIPTIMVVAFVIWHIFCGEDCYLNICKNDKKIRELQQAIENENKHIEQLQIDINSSESDAATIERIARERHSMQQAHEDVYLVVTSNDSIHPETSDITQ